MTIYEETGDFNLKLPGNKQMIPQKPLESNDKIARQKKKKRFCKTKLNAFSSRPELKIKFHYKKNF